MAQVYRCDWTECDKTRPADDTAPHGWLALHVAEDWTASGVDYDFCCLAHLRDWAAQRCQPAHGHRGKT